MSECFCARKCLDAKATLLVIIATTCAARRKAGTPDTYTPFFFGLLEACSIPAPPVSAAYDDEEDVTLREERLRAEAEKAKATAAPEAPETMKEKHVRSAVLLSRESRPISIRIENLCHRKPFDGWPVASHCLCVTFDSCSSKPCTHRISTLQRMKELQKEKDRKEAEAREKARRELEANKPLADKFAEKARQERLVQEADLAAAMDSLGFGGSAAGGAGSAAAPAAVPRDAKSLVSAVPLTDAKSFEAFAGEVTARVSILKHAVCRASCCQTRETGYDGSFF